MKIEIIKVEALIYHTQITFKCGNITDDILIEPDATDAEIKKAIRNRLRKHSLTDNIKKRLGKEIEV